MVSLLVMANVTHGIISLPVTGIRALHNARQWFGWLTRRPTHTLTPSSDFCKRVRSERDALETEGDGLLASTGAATTAAARDSAKRAIWENFMVAKGRERGRMC